MLDGLTEAGWHAPRWVRTSGAFAICVRLFRESHFDQESTSPARCVGDSAVAGQRQAARILRNWRRNRAEVIGHKRRQLPKINTRR